MRSRSDEGRRFAIFASVPAKKKKIRPPPTSVGRLESEADPTVFRSFTSIQSAKPEGGLSIDGDNNDGRGWNKNT